MIHQLHEEAITELVEWCKKHHARLQVTNDKEPRIELTTWRENPAYSEFPFSQTGRSFFKTCNGKGGTFQANVIVGERADDQDND